MSSGAASVIEVTDDAVRDDDPAGKDEPDEDRRDGDVSGETEGEAAEVDPSRRYWIDLPSLQLPQHVIDSAQYARSILDGIDWTGLEAAQRAAASATSGIDWAQVAGTQQIAASALASINWSHVAGVQQMASSALATIDWQAFTLPRNYLRSFERLRDAWPPNWDDGTRLDPLGSLVSDDGIPVVWLPRADVLQEVTSASDREERLNVLMERQTDCLDDARNVLAATTHPALAGQVILAWSALDSLADGHHQSAQALSCVVIESATRRDIAEGSRRTAKLVTDRLDEAALVELRLWMALAPLARFYDEWRSEKTSGPAPALLNRHATVHGGSPDHFNTGNALVAVLLATSVLRALQELAEEREHRGDPTWPWT